MTAPRRSLLDRLLGRDPSPPDAGAGTHSDGSLNELDELLIERAQALEIARRQLADLTVRARLERGSLAAGGAEAEAAQRALDDIAIARAELTQVVEDATGELVSMRRRLADQQTRAALQQNRAETERLVAQFRLNKAKVDAVIKHAFGPAPRPDTLEEAYEQLDIGRVMELDDQAPDPED